MNHTTRMLGGLWLVAALCIGACASSEVRVSGLNGALLHRDDFDRDLSSWVVEQGPHGTTQLVNGKLDIDDATGCTVWFREKITGSVRIEFEATLLQQGGLNDRVSDLNCFWMATDPAHPDDLFFNSKARVGSFKNYDALRLYYVGYGANDNKTTRLRRYPGDGTKPLLPEHDLSAFKFMNVANRTVKIQLIADQGRIQFIRDGEVVFNFADTAPFTSGWFGFRTVRNHMRLDNFRVYRLAAS
jgi:hypothetical protein